MKHMPNVAARVAVLGLVGALCATPVLADKATDARLDSLERKLDSRGLMDMLNRIEQMQRDIQQMRGDLEVQTHTLKELQRRSREQYLDIDRRLQQLETGVAGAPAGASGAPAGMAPVIAPGAATGTTTGSVTGSAPVQTTAPTRPPGAATLAPAVAPPTQTPTPPALQANERADYDQALAILREGRYNEAADAFNRFLTNYPGSGYADNATYWLGETYYVTRDFERALTTFKGLTERWPNSPKTPDSYLKTGYIYYEQQNWSASRTALETVVNEYAGSTAARLANDRLQRMKKEGR